jgi:hypothetical protein
MDWLGLIMELLTVLLAKNVDPNDLSSIVGRPIDKSTSRWRLEMKESYAGDIREALIYIEDLTAGDELVTTIELKLAKPWRTEPEILEAALGGRGRSVAGTHPGSAGTLIYGIKREGRRASVLVSERAVDRDSNGSMDIDRILVRRIYDD